MHSNLENDEAQAPELQSRRDVPLFFRPLAGRERQWKHRSERIADCNFPRGRMEQINAEDPFGWALTHCVFCGDLVASVILDGGQEHYANLMLDEGGRLCAVVAEPHGCNWKFAAFAASEADRGRDE